MTGKPIVFDIHPNEFIDESNEKRSRVNRSSNPISNFLQSTLRSKLKVKNLGRKGADIYEREIMYFISKGYHFSTIMDYCKHKNLI
jgi:hypothetical protein